MFVVVLVQSALYDGLLISVSRPLFVFRLVPRFSFCIFFYRFLSLEFILLVFPNCFSLAELSQSKKCVAGKRDMFSQSRISKLVVWLTDDASDFITFLGYIIGLCCRCC